MVRRPHRRNQPDCARKIYIATWLCCYLFYLLGELLASQFNHYISAQVLKSGDTNQSYYGKPAAGDYLKTFVFKPGSRYNWNEMIQKATGEKLTARYYAEQFVQ